MAVGVVVRPGRPAEAVEQTADQVGRVGARRLHDVGRALQRADRAAERRPRGCVELRQAEDDRRDVGEHVADLADDGDGLMDDGFREPQHVGQPRRRRLRVAQRGAQVGQRAAQLGERGVRGAQRLGRAAQCVVERLRLACDRVRHLGAVGDTRLEVARARRDAVHDARGFDKRALERRLIADELVRGAARLGQGRVERGELTL